MKTRVFFYILLANCLFTINMFAQTLTLEWVKQMGGNGFDGASSITTDASSNVYTTGTFQETVDFDPGSGTTNLTAVGSADIYIQKLDAGGNLLWVKQIGGMSTLSSASIAIDAGGNVYTTGSFEGTADFDPGPGTVTLTSNGGYDIYIQKLDSNGNLIWVKQMGGSAYIDYGVSITIDAENNVYSTGSFANTVDFDPGAGTENLVSNGGGDIYIQKLDSNGNFLWVKQMGGTSSDAGLSITLDVSGNLYTTGYFAASVDFDPGAETFNLTSIGSDDIFIQKLDSNGNFLWVKQMGGEHNDHGVSTTTDASGNVFTTGFFYYTVDFDPNSGTFSLTSFGNKDIFIQKLDPSGNFLWVKQMGGNSDDFGQSIATDANGNVYTTGYFLGTADFDPGSDTTFFTSMGLYDLFIQKLDASGDLSWVVQIGGTGFDYGISITTNAGGNVYTTGSFQETVDFDPGTEISNLTSNGSSDIYIQKISQTSVGFVENTFSENMMVYPNPTIGKFSIEFENHQESVTVRLLSVAGQLIMNKQFQNMNRIQLEINQPNGMYILEIIDGQGKITAVKIIKE